MWNQQNPVTMNTSIYLKASQLTPNEANEKARPGELPEARAKRIEKIASSIKALNQFAPVLVIEVEDDSTVRYEYVDGGGRVDAISLLNSQGDPRPVWCSVLPGDVDLFQTAVRNNLDRFGNSVTELIAIVRESMERNGWSGRGANKKTATYLGLPESRVAELLKIAAQATPKMRTLMASGEIATVETALRLVSLPDDKIDEIVTGAVEIAKEKAVEKAKADPKVKSGTMVVTSETRGHLVEEAFLPDSKPAKVSVGISDVREAAQNAGETIGPLPKKDLLEFFAEKCGPAYSSEVQAFCDYFVGTYAKGQGTDRTCNKLFDAMTFQTKESKAENKLKAKEAADAAKLEAKELEDKAKAKAAAQKEKDKAKGKK